MAILHKQTLDEKIYSRLASSAELLDHFYNIKHRLDVLESELLIKEQVDIEAKLEAFVDKEGLTYHDVQKMGEYTVKKIGDPEYSKTLVYSADNYEACDVLQDEIDMEEFYGNEHVGAVVITVSCFDIDIKLVEPEKFYESVPYELWEQIENSEFGGFLNSIAVKEKVNAYNEHFSSFAEKEEVINSIF